MADHDGQATRRQRHGATALTIERSAVVLVLEHGLDAVTVDMICAASGVSQRTFFNYFPTKDAAILGSSSPALDESRVRAFLASDGANLLAELIGVVDLTPVAGADAELAAGRMRMLAQTPSLLQKEMQRLFGILDELEEILFLRMRRTAPAAETAEQTREQAGLAVNLAAGILRFVIERWGVDAGPDALQRVAPLLGAVLPKLLPAPGRLP